MHNKEEGHTLVSMWSYCVHTDDYFCVDYDHKFREQLRMQDEEKAFTYETKIFGELNEWMKNSEELMAQTDKKLLDYKILAQNRNPSKPRKFTITDLSDEIDEKF